MIKFQNYIYKKFTSQILSKGGRNRMGRITLHHRGSRCALKRKFLNVDLMYSTVNLSYILLQIRPAPRRTAYVGLILFKNGLFSYVLVENTAIIGTVWFHGIYRILKKGDYLKMSLIPDGTFLYNVELKLGCGGQIARSAGTFVQIINKFPNKYNKILLKFRSGDEYFVNASCGANMGVSSNTDHWLTKIGSAGKKRLFGFRPCVRGVAMNPVDHPHGGNTNGGRPCMTPYGLLTKGVKTRKKVIRKNIIFKRGVRKIDCLEKTQHYKLYLKK